MCRCHVLTSHHYPVTEAGQQNPKALLQFSVFVVKKRIPALKNTFLLFEPKKCVSITRQLYNRVIGKHILNALHRFHLTRISNYELSFIPAQSYYCLLLFTTLQAFSCIFLNEPLKTIQDFMDIEENFHTLFGCLLRHASYLHDGSLFLSLHIPSN